jgi:aromatic ring-opening dioxygenase catalytic subunit (LigB family)
MTRKLPTFYVSHGAGPWPWMEGQMRDAHDQLAVALRQIPQLVAATPKAVLMISAHWEEPDFSVMAHPCPPMLYDYQGFPEHTYHVQYAAPGAPQLADLSQGGPGPEIAPGCRARIVHAEGRRCAHCWQRIERPQRALAG